MKRPGAGKSQAPRELPGRLALDTSTYSHLARGDERVIDALARADAIFVPTIVLGELEGAFRCGARTAENAKKLREFLADPLVHVADVTAEVARRYGELFAALRRAGTPIPVNDIWIAATTLVCGAHLVTFDSDFDLVPALPVTVLAVL